MAYGAALVSSRMCLSLRSCGSGRFWRCFSRELRRSRGEMGEVSIGGFSGGGELFFSAIMTGVVIGKRWLGATAVFYGSFKYTAYGMVWTWDKVKVCLFAGPLATRATSYVI